MKRSITDILWLELKCQFYKDPRFYGCKDIDKKWQEYNQYIIAQSEIDWEETE